jgi:hypothetical protein
LQRGTNYRTAHCLPHLPPQEAGAFGTGSGPTRNRTENLLIKSLLARRDQQTLGVSTKHNFTGP